MRTPSASARARQRHGEARAAALRVLGAGAFVLWAAALPETPFNDWKSWNPDYGVAAITISALFLNPGATLLGLKAQWGKSPTD